jgi:hypothetical protein
MKRFDTFTFRVNKTERELLERLSLRLQRSQSDALRWLLREAVRELDADDLSGDGREPVGEVSHES